MVITMPIEPVNATAGLARYRLFQLISPSLPIGAFTYSQGIEWAVENGWIEDSAALHEWLSGLLQTSMAQQEFPLLLRLHRAWQAEDMAAIDDWSDYVLASRETAELRQEELNRARALSDLLPTLIPSATEYRDRLRQSQTSAYAYACVAWEIDEFDSCRGFAWGWLENLVLAAVKIIPLGQTQGQQLLLDMAEQLDAAIDQAFSVVDDDIGASSLALAMASSRHETQYTRLFRS